MMTVTMTVHLLKFLLWVNMHELSRDLQREKEEEDCGEDITQVNCIVSRVSALR